MPPPSPGRPLPRLIEPLRGSSPSATRSSPRRGRARSPLGCGARRRDAGLARRRWRRARRAPASRRARARSSPPRRPRPRRARAASRCRRFPGPTAQTTASCPVPRRPGERGRDVHALDLAAEARARRRPCVASRPRSRSARTESESATGSAPPSQLDVGDAQRRRRAPRRPPRAGCAASSRRPACPSSAGCQLGALLGVDGRELQRRVRQLDHVRPVARGAARARVSGSRRARRNRRSRARARAPGR